MPALQSGRHNAALILQELQEKEPEKENAPTGIGARYFTGSSISGTCLYCQEKMKEK